MSARTFPPAKLPVVIPAWEIECCAPPPVVGQLTSWRLAFQPIATSDPAAPDHFPESVSTQLWQVEEWPADDDKRTLYRNSLIAYCYRPVDAGPSRSSLAPPLGRHLLRGVLYGTRHGGSDYDLLPAVSATVARIQVMSCHIRQQDRAATPVPGSTRLVDVQRSPKWLTRHPSGPVTSVPAGAGSQRRAVQEG